MAAALFNALAHPDKARADSAGTQPGSRIHPVVVDVMREVGIDLSSAHPYKLTAELAAGSAWLVTMGCGEECPFIPGARREDWLIDDPRDRPLDEVRRIRDEIAARVRGFVTREAWDR